MEVGLFVLDDLVAVELKDFHVLELFPVNRHSDEGDLLVEAAVARRAWIDVKQVEPFVVHHL